MPIAVTGPGPGPLLRAVRSAATARASPAGEHVGGDGRDVRGPSRTARPEWHARENRAKRLAPHQTTPTTTERLRPRPNDSDYDRTAPTTTERLRPTCASVPVAAAAPARRQRRASTSAATVS